MTHDFAPVAEWTGVDRTRFREEILPRNAPAVLRGLVADWPAVAAGRASPADLAAYVRERYRGGPVEAFVGGPEIGGRFFYDEDLRGYNFEKRAEPFTDTLARILAAVDQADGSAVYAGAMSIPEHFPAFMAENPLELADRTAMPRLWVGNALTVSTHYDLSENIACVVGGRRRFTLFPPEQLVNLYVGPLEFTLAGQPVSMASLDDPDFAAHPRFREALAHAQSAELEPGDAIFIPYHWWHQVSSHAPVNVMVNYWWDEARHPAGSPFEGLIHAILTIRHLPPERRALWKTVFDHYIFGDVADSTAHLPAHARGVLGEMTPRTAQIMKEWLKRAIGR